MRDQAITVSGAADSRSPLKRAAVRSSKASRDGMLERLFAFAFDGLVYPQIWEDPAVDMAAMDIQPDHHIVAITSGGCNVMSYLTADPARITAVDLNIAHLSLLELKLKAARHLPSHSDFARFFADANSPLNPELYDLFIEPHLSSDARTYWSTKRQFGGRRIDLFAKGFLQIRTAGPVHFAGPRRCAPLWRQTGRDHVCEDTGRTTLVLCRQAGAFVRQAVDPVADVISDVAVRPRHPPAQYAELAGGRHMADVLKERLGALACDHSLSDNYFARQAFGRSYADPAGKAKLPPYLEPANWRTVRAAAQRVRTAKNPITDVLEAHPENSVDRVVLLDAQDWMDKDQINALWAAITRAAKPGARVIFRTAAVESPLEEKVDATVLERWTYHRERSRQLGANDRSAIYGGFHMYELR
jgi:S-adenosylmethionine-diacylglycerol 3-amino-3-carboxypropyl transferase